MKIELDNFIIESDQEISYFNEIVDYIINNEKRIFDFFKLNKLPNKVNILILSYEPFKDYIISKYGEILNYISGDSDSKTHTIRVLNVEDQIKYTTHKNASVEIIKSTILHEIVHQCHHIYNTDYRYTSWFSEGLALNLANQNNKIVDLHNCDFDALKNDFMHYKGNYDYAYTIVNYILNNYPKEKIEKLYSNPEYLKSIADTIFEEAKKH